jgi:hypothetical protein
MNCKFLPVFVLLTSLASAGDAFFSADGKTVTFAPLMRSGHLLRVSTESGKLTELPLPPALKTATVTGLARGGEGEALFIASGAVWVMKEDGTVKKVCETGAVENPEKLFVSVKPGQPLTDWLFLSGSTKEPGAMPVFFARKPGQKAFDEVFCRRVSNVNCGVFADDGRFFFAGRGDIWEGGLVEEKDPGMRAASLVGARIAPVATLNTDSSNSGGMWVEGLSPAGKWLYTGLRGRHMGAVLRVPIPAKPLYNDDSADQPEPKQQLDAMRAALDKTELLIADTGGLTSFCACEINDKGQVFYRGERDDQGLGIWLWNGSGAPRRLTNEPDE